MAKKKISNWLADSTPSGARLEKNPDNDYETEGHLRTLMEAHGIMNDPEKMEKVHALAGRKVGQIRSIQDIKKASQQLAKTGVSPLQGMMKPHKPSSEDDDGPNE